MLTLLLSISLLGADPAEDKEPTPFVDRVVAFMPGPGAGYGEKKFPDVVLGPPKGGGKLKAGIDVLSLGNGGTIVLEFVDNEVFDGEGPDLLVFENPFLQGKGDDPDLGFFELAKVEVSSDGENWTAFPFDTGTRKGCAGHHPVFANADENDISPTDPAKAGGDPFDLREIGVKSCRFVRISDLKTNGGEKGTAGFDLDAVAAVNSRPRGK
jgi:hypothetical protein